MESGAEDPTGYLSTLQLSMLRLGSLNHALREWNVFLTEPSMVVPPDIAGVTESTSQSVDHGHRRVEGETGEIDVGGEKGVVASVELCQDTGSWVHDGEIVEGFEETSGGRYRELPKPLRNHRLAIADTNTPNEDVETIQNDGRVEVAKFGYGDEVLQGRQAGGSFQGGEEDPRDAVQVQCDCSLVQATRCVGCVRNPVIGYPAERVAVRCLAGTEKKPEYN